MRTTTGAQPAPSKRRSSPTGAPAEKAGAAANLDSGADIDELVTAVLTASRVLVDISTRSLASVEETVTIPQFRTLVVLDTYHGINVNRLAELLDVAPSSTVRMVDRLIAAALVTRAENPENRREVVLGLTPDGRRIVQRVTGKRRERIARIVRAMPVKHREALVSSLQSFAEAAHEPQVREETADPVRRRPIGRQSRTDS